VRSHFAHTLRCDALVGLMVVFLRAITNQLEAKINIHNGDMLQ